MDSLGYNDSKQIESFSSFLIPSIQEALLYFIISFSIILLANVKTIWGLLGEYSDINAVTSSEAFTAQLAVFDKYFASNALGQATVFIVWGIIGCLAYMIVWAVQHFYVRLKHDVDDSNNEHVKRSVKGYWQSRFAQHLFFGASIFIFLVAIIAGFMVFPLISTLGRMSIYNLSVFSDYRFALAGLILGAFYIYVLVRLWKVTRYTVSLYFANTD